MILPASYSNGFAPRDGSPLYPSLWRGCVGAWAPCLGPTGLTLRDWSGFANHGTLTNMDPGTDGVTSQGRYALDFDGTNDSVLIGNIERLAFERTQRFSVSAWVRPNTVAGVAYAVVGNSVAAFPNTGWSVVLFRRSNFTATAVSFFLAASTLNLIEVSSPAASISAASWQHVCVTYAATSSAAGVEIYVNGRQQSKIVVTDTLSSSAVPATSVVIGGRPDNAQYFPGQIDDVALHNRTLSPNEIATLASRRGIAYEMAPRRRSSSAVQFNRRRRLLLGAS